MTVLTTADVLDAEEALSRAELRDLQEQRLLEMVPYAYEKSALTRMLWDEAGVTPREIRSLDDFVERAPFLNQDALRAFRARTADPFAGTLCVPRGELGYLGSTSGTTGNPTPVAHGPHGPTETARGRELWMLGARPGDAIALMMFSFRSGIDLLCERAPEIGLRRIFLSHTPAQLPQLFEATREFRPKLLYLLSTPMIMAIDAYAEANRLDVRTEFASYSAALYGGEPLGPWAQRKLADWGLRIAQITAAGDALPATECLAGAGCHVWEDLVLAEHLEPGGSAPAAEGERGELVTTSLHDPATPLVRFRTEDLVHMDRSTCACGRSHARMRTLGRAKDLVRIGSRSVLPADVAAALSDVSACQAGLFQVVLTDGPARALSVRVGYDAARTVSTVGLREQVQRVLAGRLDVPVEVELVAEADLLKLGPPHKIPRTVRA